VDARRDAHVLLKLPNGVLRIGLSLSALDPSTLSSGQARGLNLGSQVAKRLKSSCQLCPWQASGQVSAPQRKIKRVLALLPSVPNHHTKASISAGLPHLSSSSPILGHIERERRNGDLGGTLLLLR